MPYILRWVDTTEETIDAWQVDFWRRKSGELQGWKFWGDSIRKLKTHPNQRLDLALENLPVGAAFMEAAEAQFDIISTRKYLGLDSRKDLAVYYWLCAMRSLMVPYASRLKEPGYNVMEVIPGRMLRRLYLPWQDLGYERLPFVNKISAQWLLEAYGKPRSHNTLFDLRNDLWMKYENRLIERRRDADDELRETLRGELNGRKTEAYR